jgi:polar amino acid transport system permease protein
MGAPDSSSEGETMTVQAAAGEAVPPIVLQIEAADRRHRTRFRVWFFATWIVVLGLVGGFLIATVGINVGFLQEWLPFIIGGVWITLFISVVSIVIAVVLAIFGALGRLSANPIFNGIASLYVSIVRGTPLIVQILFIFLALPAAGIVVPPLPTGIIALSFNYGAYLTEVFRAGIQAVPNGQVEAARALGLPEREVMRKVILPQAVRIVTPVVGNDFIAMTKDSALVSIVGVQELLWRAQSAGRPTGQSFQTIIVAALMYWVLTLILSVFQARLERRMAAGDRLR